jgi:hypothetical protein
MESSIATLLTRAARSCSQRSTRVGVCGRVRRSGVCVRMREEEKGGQGYVSALKTRIHYVTLRVSFKKKSPLHLLTHHTSQIHAHIAAFGLTVIEAMTCGLPTFATSRGGPSEIIQHKRRSAGAHFRLSCCHACVPTTPPIHALGLKIPGPTLHVNLYPSMGYPIKCTLACFSIATTHTPSACTQWISHRRLPWRRSCGANG